MGRIVCLELANFKSYAGKQTIGPFSNFTTIIGPNGSGKSNLMDAICFVLGIRASHLRGTQLGDLVYHDDEHSGPKKASVSLTYEVDGGEVEGMDAGEHLHFSRSVDLGGSCTYRLRKKRVTWEEYNKQMKSLNILVKTKNFLVFQGEVENLGSKSPAELTALIEHISGSDSLKGDYERLEGEKNKAEEAIAFAFRTKRGIEKEKKQVKQQKTEAERYQQSLDELRSLKTEFFLWQLFHLQKDMAAHDEVAAQHRKELTKIEKEAGICEAQIQEQKKALNAAMRKKHSLEKKVKKLQTSSTKAAPMRVKLQQGVIHSENLILRHTTDIAKFTQLHETQQSELAKLRSDVEELESAVLELAQTEGATSDVSLNDAQLEQYEAIKVKVMAKTADLSSEISHLQRSLTSKTDRLQRLLAEREEFLRRRTTLTSESASHQKRVEKIETTIQIAEKEAFTVEAELNQVEKRTAKAERKKEKFVAELTSVSGKLRMMKDTHAASKQERKMADALEVLQTSYPDVYGRLGDLVKPSNSKYSSAVTVALGRFMDAVVVGTSSVARECIQYMRDHRVGRTFFLPLDSIQPTPVNERHRTFGEGYRLAVDVLQFDPRLENAVLYACGSTIIAEDMTLARDLCFHRGERIKTVTLTGGVIHKGGTMAGGSSSQDRSRASKWDAKAVEKLRKDRDRLGALIAEVDASLEEDKRAENLTRLNDRLQSAKKMLQFGKGDLKSANERLKSALKEVKTNAAALEQLEGPVEELKAEVDRLEEALRGKTAAKNAIEDKLYRPLVSSIEGMHSIRDFETNVVAAHEERVARRRKVMEQKQRLQAKIEYEERHDHREGLKKAKRALKSEKKNLDRLREHLEQSTAQTESLEQRVTEVEQQQQAIREEIDQLNAELNAIRKSARAVSLSKTEASQQLTKQETALERLRARRHDLLQKAKLEDVKLPTTDDASDSDSSDSDDVEEHSSVRSSEISVDAVGYSQSVDLVKKDAVRAEKIDFSGLTSNLAISDQETTLKVQNQYLSSLRQIQSDLDRMQPNMHAMEQFNAVTDRLGDSTSAFLTAKQQATKAKERFERIKTRRVRRFNKAFSHIADKVDRVYKELTKTSANTVMAGAAYLTVEDTELPFSAGVRYTAMPPMKRFRSMEELSGGEKVIAALALLFAIHSYRPSPFFILDEIDAPLDNPNVMKLAKYLRKRKKDLQIIVISLKELFYEKADTLIGIRKAETTVSSTLTLDLTAYDE